MSDSTGVGSWPPPIPQAPVPVTDLPFAPPSAPAFVTQPAPAVPVTPTQAAAPAQTAPPTTTALTAPPPRREAMLQPSVAPIDLTEHARTKADPELIEALVQVVRQGASDLHVTAGSPPMLRVDGSLRPADIMEQPWSADRVSEALATLLTPDQQKRFDAALELDLAYSLSPEYRFRINYYVQRGAIGAAFRLIPIEIKQLKELGIPENIGHFASLPRGLVLVTGPTGSGKSTTLAALIDLVNSTRADHIVTVEDPIEFTHTHKMSIVNQREIGEDTHSFSEALKHVLRQDPDVILIGELRDLETISVALTAAETGHLVFATLHTQDAPQSVDRIIDVFPPHQQAQVRTQLAGTLQGIVSQTLVPKASGTGRVVATEILLMTPAISNLIREGKTYQIPTAMQAGRALGMHTMDQHLADLFNVGLITHEAAMSKAHDEDGLKHLMQRSEAPRPDVVRSMSGGPDFGDRFSSTEN
ncbi:type IV pilus twitching motility protein PilT [Rathayibacter soli]|uniref:type IV pilus twitching motility protein PilT n=1 Tax=Rathayibacter soli TaxID=3144168 RepID=UPI0027E47779|nr:type IV pilus twitching motility protein PilT [Glaciibacter superstes]